jgi:hypothetical protein
MELPVIRNICEMLRKSYILVAHTKLMNKSNDSDVMREAKKYEKMLGKHIKMLEDFEAREKEDKLNFDIVNEHISKSTTTLIQQWELVFKLISD